MDDRLPHRSIVRAGRHEVSFPSAATSSEIDETRVRKSLGPLFLTMLSVGVCFFAGWFLLSVSDAHDQNIRRQSVLTSDNRLPPWKSGMLDIHHLHVGPSESTFIIYPDGTTMLIDAGDVDLPRALPRLWQSGRRELKIRPPYPNSSKSTGEWILDYMYHFWPRPEEQRKSLDYFLLTHFHAGHMGDPGPDSPQSKEKSYLLSGITEIASQLQIDKIVDRAYPDYDFPIDLSRWPSKALANYRKFITEGYLNQNVSKVEKFDVGSKTQFIEKKNPSGDFHIHNVKCNLDVVNENGDVVKIEGELFTDADKISWDENELSCAVVVQYGAFRYYEGGDQEAHRNKLGQIDSITPTAKAAGPVDVATANHHGRGVSTSFCDELDPEIVIFQGIFSDQPFKSTMNILTEPRKSDGKTRTLLATDIYEERLKAIGEKGQAFASIGGHVVVRVYEPGPDQYYEIYVLDGEKIVRSKLGPFKPRS